MSFQIHSSGWDSILHSARFSVMWNCSNRGLAFTYFCVYVVRQVHNLLVHTAMFSEFHEVFCVSTSTGHNFLVCILSHQGKGGHRCGRCCGMRLYRCALDQTRHRVVSFHCRLESLVWNLVDFSAVSSRVESVTGILQPRLEEPSENEFKL